MSLAPGYDIFDQALDQAKQNVPQQPQGDIFDQALIQAKSQQQPGAVGNTGDPGAMGDAGVPDQPIGYSQSGAPVYQPPPAPTLPIEQRPHPDLEQIYKDADPTNPYQAARSIPYQAPVPQQLNPAMQQQLQQPGQLATTLGSLAPPMPSAPTQPLSGPQPRYVRVPKDDLEETLHQDNPPDNIYHFKLPDGDYAVDEEFAKPILKYAAMQRQQAQPKQTFGEGMANVPINVATSLQNELAGKTFGFLANVLPGKQEALHHAEDYYAQGAQTAAQDSPVTNPVAQMIQQPTEFAGLAAASTTYPGGMAGQMAVSQFQNTFNQAKQNGLDESEARTRGLASAMTALLTMKYVHLPAGEAANIGDRLAAATASGSSIVAVQNYADQLLAKVGTPEKVDVNEILATVATQGPIMAAMGMGHGGESKPDTMQTPDMQAGDYGGLGQHQQQTDNSPASIAGSGADRIGSQIQPPQSEVAGQDVASPDYTTSPENPLPPPADQQPQPNQRQQNPAEQNHADQTAVAAVAHDQSLPQQSPPDTGKTDVASMERQGRTPPEQGGAESHPPVSEPATGSAAAGEGAGGYTPEEIRAVGVPDEVIAKLESNVPKASDGYTPEEIKAVGVPDEIINKLESKNATGERIGSENNPQERTGNEKGGTSTQSELGGGVQAGGEVPPDAQSGRGKAEPKPVESSPTSIKNRIVDQERVARGLEPMMQPAAKEFGKSWDEAAKKVDENPNAANDLIDELKKKPRALNDTDVAMLLRRKIELRNERDKVQKEIIDSKKNGGEVGPELRQRLAGISDGLLDIDTVGKQGGTESARGLSIRRMMAKEDFSLAAMETAKRAANGGNELTEEQSKHIADLHEKINATQKAFDDYVAKQESRQSRVAEIKAKSGYGSKNKLVTSDAYKAALDTLKSQKLYSLESIVGEKLPALLKIAAYHIEAGARSFAAFSAKMKKDLGDDITPHLKDLHELALADPEYQKAQAEKADASKLKAMKTRTQNHILDLAQRMVDENYDPKPAPKPLALDKEGERLKAENERMKQQFQYSLLRDRLKNRTMGEKVQDAFVKYRRAGVLSGPITIAKLASAAAQRMVFTPIEELVGGGISKVLPGLAKSAPRQGGLSIKAEARAVTSSITKGMADAWRTIRTGKSDLDVLHGKEDAVPPSVLDFFGRIHAALKAPVKRAEYERSVQKLTEKAIANNVDPNDPMVQMRIMKDSYVEANKAIFMQDNRFARGWNNMVSSWEQPDKETGKPSVGGKIAATTARTLLPIVKVPTNIVAETFKYALGLPVGAAKTLGAYLRGIDTLKPEQADAIMSMLKKGSMGAAVMAIGYFGAGDIGGYYQPGEKRKEGDVKAGSLRVFGHDVPTWALHNPLTEVLQIGATIRRVADAKLKKSDEDVQGVGQGSVAAAMGLIEEVPFMQEAKSLTDFADPKKRPGATGRLAESIAVPAGVQQAAKYFDKRDAQGEPVKRKPGSVMDNVKMGIPGLRQQVPEVEQKLERVQAPGHAERVGVSQEHSGPLYDQTVENSLKLYEKMSDADKKKYGDALKTKIFKSHISPDEKERLINSIP